jgi:hypothetical protein
MILSKSSASGSDLSSLGNLGWKYYNQVKSKAMEQEFSWSGLAVSLSIAFFVVVATAQGLNIAFKSINADKEPSPDQDKVYFLESASRLEKIQLA